MADYTVYITRRASKELSKNVAHQDKDRVKEAITALGKDPRPHGCRKVRSAPTGTFRIRVGDYRVIYRVRDKEEAVVVALVRRRSEDTYRNV
jgi:mRNA interferase RelE/StbE